MVCRPSSVFGLHAAEDRLLARRLAVGQLRMRRTFTMEINYSGVHRSRVNRPASDNRQHHIDRLGTEAVQPSTSPSPIIVRAAAAATGGDDNTKTFTVQTIGLYYFVHLSWSLRLPQCVICSLLMIIAVSLMVITSFI